MEKTVYRPLHVLLGYSGLGSFRIFVSNVFEMGSDYISFLVYLCVCTHSNAVPNIWTQMLCSARLEVAISELSEQLYLLESL